MRYCIDWILGLWVGLIVGYVAYAFLLIQVGDK